MENELKAYNWIIVAYSGLENVLISKFVKIFVWRRKKIGQLFRKYLKISLEIFSNIRLEDA